ncbi:MAG: hypothetical protein MUE51_15960 [Thermoleophilia bacterium]|nr:hypothetical protein [Thermoleophilia bacterium]
MIELPGQPLAERVLRAALARPNPPQQLLMYGPPGSGKRDVARRVAWALIDPDGEHGPGQASVDLSIVRASGTFIRLEPDLEPALADLATRPLVGRRRVMIIEGAERLRPQEGADRILKSLEEPPPRSHLILVSDRPGDLEPTIRSRCLPVPFRTPGWRAIRDVLIERGVAPEDAEARARADGTIALDIGPFDLRMRTLGIDLGLGALAGKASAPQTVAAIQQAMERAAAEHPSEELTALRAEAAALAGRRGEKTAIKRAEDQQKRERRRLVTDGWGHVLDGAAALIADALALSVGTDVVVRHRSMVDRLRPLADPDRQAFLERALEELQQAKADLILNPTPDLAMEALLGRIAAARAGHAGPLVRPGRLGP